MRRSIAILLAVATAIYPFFLFFTQKYLPAHFISIILCVLLLGRAWFIGLKKPLARLLILCAALVFFGVFVLHQASILLWYPVLVSLGFLIVFSYSLYTPPTIIERIARLTDPNLSENGVRYTRKITALWACFFLVNALVATWTIFTNDLQLWTVYNGLISYLLMGFLFVMEYIYRQFYRRRHA